MVKIPIVASVYGYIFLMCIQKRIYIETLIVGIICTEGMILAAVVDGLFSREEL